MSHSQHDNALEARRIAVSSVCGQAVRAVIAVKMAVQ